MIGRDESGLGLRAAIVAGLAGTTLLAGNAIADFNDAVVVRYQVEATEADGTPVSVTVEDLYLLTDDPKDVDLNIYDVYLPASGQVPYFQSQTGPGWTPTNIGGPFDTTALRYADSFVTVGGFEIGTPAAPQAPGAGGASAIDPFFGGNDVAYPIDRAGCYKSSLPNLQGFAGQTPAGLGVLIGRFAYAGEFTIVGTQLSVTMNQDIGTPGVKPASRCVSSSIATAISSRTRSRSVIPRSRRTRAPLVGPKRRSAMAIGTRGSTRRCPERTPSPGRPHAADISRGSNFPPRSSLRCR